MLVARSALVLSLRLALKFQGATLLMCISTVSRHEPLRNDVGFVAVAQHVQTPWRLLLHEQRPEEDGCLAAELPARAAMFVHCMSSSSLSIQAR